MIEIVDKKDCCDCEACMQICPKRCISMESDAEGFLYPKVDVDLCVGCNLCEKVCPVINRFPKKRPDEVRAAKNPDEEVRLGSSSGGVFTMLAEKVLESGGVVFGARFDDGMDVIHDYTETVEGLQAFRGSKYVQSRIGCTYKQAEKFLKEGRGVLFSGTSCQIAGLKHFLRKEYDNLLAVDVICHGAPSPKVWREYFKEIKLRPEGVAGKNTVLSSLNESSGISDVSFRDKRYGWEKYGFAIRTAACKAAQNSVLQSYGSSDVWFYEPYRQNLFMRGFLANLYLRPSCYDCPAKGGSSGSDLTLGDFWGIRRTYPEYFDDKGVSVVLINSDKGKVVFESVGADNIEAAYEAALSGNRSIERSVRIPRYRAYFFREFEREGVGAIEKSLVRQKSKFFKRCIYAVKDFFDNLKKR